MDEQQVPTTPTPPGGNRPAPVLRAALQKAFRITVDRHLPGVLGGLGIATFVAILSRGSLAAIGMVLALLLMILGEALKREWNDDEKSHRGGPGGVGE